MQTTFSENNKGPSINYVVSKLAIFDPFPLLVIFLLRKIGIESKFVATK